MFEKWSQPAKRVIFFARYYAGLNPTSGHIEISHLKMGLIYVETEQREGINGVQLPPPNSTSLPTSLEIPLSNDSKKVIMRATQISETLNTEVTCKYIESALNELNDLKWMEGAQ